MRVAFGRWFWQYYLAYGNGRVWGGRKEVCSPDRRTSPWIKVQKGVPLTNHTRRAMKSFSRGNTASPRTRDAPRHEDVPRDACARLDRDAGNHVVLTAQNSGESKVNIAPPIDESFCQWSVHTFA